MNNEATTPRGLLSRRTVEVETRYARMRAITVRMSLVELIRNDDLCRDEVRDLIEEIRAGGCYEYSRQDREGYYDVQVRA